MNNNSKATPIEGAITVNYEGKIEGQHWLTITGGMGAEAYPAYLAAPAALRYEGQEYAKVSYNSDTGRIAYRTGVPYARVSR